jgi:2-oxoglutarate ferredoxin oxidoreductase subunit delta
LTRTVKEESSAVLTINQQWCKGCGICVAFCPREALFINTAGKAEKLSDKCTACGVCELFCPDFALAVVRKGVEPHGGS